MESIIIESIKNMSLLDCVILLILIIGVDWLKSYFTKKGSNNADKEDTRITSYEGKKGVNVADEEDQLNQGQKERLIRILYLAEKINQSITKYVLYFYDYTTRAKFDRLVEDLNSLLTDVYHEQRLANLFLPKEEQEVLDNLLTCLSGITVELSTNSTNAASRITIYNEYLQRAREDQASKIYCLNEANVVRHGLKVLSEKELEFKNDLQEAIKKYVEWLEGYIKQNIRTIN
jgi:hypothetical protein